MYECPGGEDDGGDRLGLLSELKTRCVGFALDPDSLDTVSGLGIRIRIRAGKIEVGQGSL